MIALKVQLGFEGTRSTSLEVSTSHPLRYVANLLVWKFRDYFGSCELAFVKGDNSENATILRLSKTVNENELDDLHSITAVRLQGWKVRLEATLILHECACKRHNCCSNTLGPNIRVNENALRPVFKVGRRTCLSELLDRCSSDAAIDWGPANLTNRLNFARRARCEWLWHCSMCEKTAFTRFKECEPHDESNCFPWQESQTKGTVWCGACYQRLLECKTFEEVHCNRTCCDDSWSGWYCYTCGSHYV